MSTKKRESNHNRNVAGTTRRVRFTGSADEVPQPKQKKPVQQSAFYKKSVKGSGSNGSGGRT